MLAVWGYAGQTGVFCVLTEIANFARFIEGDDRAIIEWQSYRDQLSSIHSIVRQLLDRTAIKSHYSVEEFSKLVGKVEFTVRQWCNLGRINAEKSMTRSGSATRWVISRDEYERYSREGLLPLQKPVRRLD
jgi:hypothetical protein